MQNPQPLMYELTTLLESLHTLVRKQQEDILSFNIESLSANLTEQQSLHERYTTLFAKLRENEMSPEKQIVKMIADLRNDLALVRRLNERSLAWVKEYRKVISGTSEELATIYTSNGHVDQKETKSILRGQVG